MLGIITQGITLEHVCISALGAVIYMYTHSIYCDPVDNMTASRSSGAQTRIERSRIEPLFEMELLRRLQDIITSHGF